MPGFKTINLQYSFLLSVSSQVHICYITFNSISCIPSCFVFTVLILYSFKYIDAVRNECISLFLPFALVIKVLIINKVVINISNVLYFLIHCTLTHILYHIPNQKEKYFNFFLNFLTYFDNSCLINEVDVNTSIFWHFLISLILRSAHTKFQTKRTSPSPFLEFSHLLDKP